MEIINISNVELPRYEYCGFIEIWNPTPEDLIALIPFLEVQSKVCLPWVYGKIKDIPDFTSVNHYRIGTPIWLGRDKDRLYDNYFKIKNNIIYGLVNYDLID